MRVDRETVIKGLEHEISRANIPTCGTDFIDCVEVALLRDALALLKAEGERETTSSVSGKAAATFPIGGRRGGGDTVDQSVRRILARNIQAHGVEAQIDKAIEEAGELIRALARFDDPDNIAEEMADVEIMIEQVKIICGNTAQVEEWKKRKIARILRKLGELDAKRGEAKREKRTDGIGGEANGDA